MKLLFIFVGVLGSIVAFGNCAQLPSDGLTQVCIDDVGDDPVHDYRKTGLGQHLDLRRVCVSAVGLGTDKTLRFRYELHENQYLQLVSPEFAWNFHARTFSPLVGVYQIYLGFESSQDFRSRWPGFVGFSIAPGKTHFLAKGNIFDALIETVPEFDRWTSQMLGAHFHWGFHSGLSKDHYQWNIQGRSDMGTATRFHGKKQFSVDVPLVQVCRIQQNCSQFYFMAASSDSHSRRGDDLTAAQAVCIVD